MTRWTVRRESRFTYWIFADEFVMWTTATLAGAKRYIRKESLRRARREAQYGRGVPRSQTGPVVFDSDA